jgi:hypothetical protein
MAGGLVLEVALDDRRATTGILAALEAIGSLSRPRRRGDNGVTQVQAAALY